MPFESGSVFVTGTDTGVGKTVVAASLLRRLGQQGRRTVGMKPVAAGLVEESGRWISQDARLLRAAANVTAPAHLDNPVALRDPLSPHLAARRVGRRLTVDALWRAHRDLRAHADLVVVEGSGGWRVPLNERETMADLAVAIGAPVLLVVGMRLGCLNHALLTAEAIERDGLRLAGWVANCIDPGMRDIEANIDTLAARWRRPACGIGRHAPGSGRPHIEWRDMESAWA